MIYWLTKIIHTLASIKKKKIGAATGREWGEAISCSERCPEAAVDSIVSLQLWLGCALAPGPNLSPEECRESLV